MGLDRMKSGEARCDDETTRFAKRWDGLEETKRDQKDIDMKCDQKEMPHD